MTQQPTARPSYPGAEQFYGVQQHPAAPQYPAAAPTALGSAFIPPPVPPAGLPHGSAPPPRRNRTKVVLSIVGGLLVPVLGLIAAAVAFFGPSTIDTNSVEEEIIRVTTEAYGLAPEGVACPEGVTYETGATITCNATLDQQPISYTVRQLDDDGNVEISNTRVLDVLEVQDVASQQLSAELGEQVVVACAPEGQTLLVNEPGSPIACAVASVADPNVVADVTVSVAADGTVTPVF